MYKIYMPLFEQMLTTGVSGPIEMWQAAENLARSSRSAFEEVKFRTIAPNVGVVKTFGGLGLYADHAFNESDKCNMVILAPMWGNPRLGVRRNKAMGEWLVQRYNSGATIVAVGTSVCFLAEHGLLDSLPATTHWYYFDMFKKFYPNVQLNTHQFITFADGIYTAGSINALSDLILYFIRENYDESIATVIEQHFSHEINRTFDQPFFTKGGHQHHDENIIAAQEWAMRNWNAQFSQKHWSEQIGMSERTFTRRFKQVIGMTPLEWLREIKMEKARELLRATNLPIDSIAENVGYADAAYFSRMFTKLVSITPLEYRKMVRDKVFSAQS